MTTAHPDDVEMKAMEVQRESLDHWHRLAGDTVAVSVALGALNACFDFIAARLGHAFAARFARDIAAGLETEVPAEKRRH